jgi:predicted metalloprotease with PDZ domain
VDDEILAIDDYRVHADQLAGRLGAYRPGDKVSLLVARLDHLLRLDTTLGAEPPNRWKLVIRKDATPAQSAHLDAWLGAEPHLAPPATVPQIAAPAAGAIGSEVSPRSPEHDGE